jgi:hypothetical protein
MNHNGALLKLFTTAAKQCGVIRHSQAAAELHSVEIQRLATAQAWKRLLPGVYADPTQSGPEQNLFAAWLWAGTDSVVSHRSAAKLLGLDGVEPKRAEVTVPPHRHPTASSVVVHRAVLPDTDRRLWNGLPITSAARTLVDLAGVASIESLAMAVDCAWRRKLVPLDWLERRVRELGTRGRRGMKALARVLRDCRARGQPLDSALEVKLWWLWPSSGLPRPVPGLEYEDEFGQPGRIDFAFLREHVAIECDGFETHSQRPCFERDCVRLSRLAALGWRVIHVTWRQLDEPHEVFERIAAALRPERENLKRRPARTTQRRTWTRATAAERAQGRTLVEIRSLGRSAHWNVNT